MEFQRNSVQVVGNLGANPELRHFESGSKLATARIAIGQGKDKKTDQWKPSTWIEIKAWGAAADQLMMFAKGSRIAVTEAKLSHDEWEKDGRKQTKINLTVFALEAVPTADKSEDSQPQASQPEVPKKLLDAIEGADTLDKLQAIKVKATKQGISFDSYESAWQAKAAELASYDDIPF